MAASSLRELGLRLLGERQLLPALGVFAESVRRTPDDHRSRMLAARCFVELGERERPVLALHACAEGLLARDFLLSALAASKLALDLNPHEKLVRDTVQRIHTRAVRTAPGRASVPPPPAPEALGDAVVEEDLTTLHGSALADKALEVLITPDVSVRADPLARPPLPLFASLTPASLADMLLASTLRTVPAGTVVLEEGQGGEAMFVIVAGQAEVARTFEGVRRRLGILPGGSIFGEVAVLTGTLPSATVVTTVESDVFELQRGTLAALAQAHPELPQTLAEFAQERMARNLMASSPLFLALPLEDRPRLLSHFSFRALAVGERVLAEGAHSEGMYLVLAGELLVQKEDPAGGHITLGVLREGEVAGEISLLNGLRATATVSATRKTACASIDRAGFHALIRAFPAVQTYLESLSSRRLREMGEALRPAETLDADALPDSPTERSP